MLPIVTQHKPGEPLPSTPDIIQQLRDEFRGRLEFFYARLQLAPPYHSVEKALTQLATALKTLPATERDRIAADPALQWAQYRAAFVASGLNRKHRGIIAGLARSRQSLDLPEEYDGLLDACLE
ncbi:MAG: hypothetical protein ACT4OO_07295 [Nitrospiraceae bacterium]